MTNKVFTTKEALDHGDEMYRMGRESILRRLDTRSWNYSPEVRFFVVEFINEMRDEGVAEIRERIKTL